MTPAWPTQAPLREEVARIANRLSEAELSIAQDALMRVFYPPSEVDVTIGHPINGNGRTCVGRLRLLELGRAIATVGALAGEAMVNRLRNPREFHGASAELRAAMLLRDSGGTLEQATRGDSSRLSEYLVRWGLNDLAVVEVKALNTPDAVERADGVVRRTINGFHGTTRMPPGYRGRLEWDTAILDDPPDGAAIDAAVSAAVTAAWASAVALASPAMIHLPRIARLIITQTGRSGPFHL